MNELLIAIKELKTTIINLFSNIETIKLKTVLQSSENFIGNVSSNLTFLSSDEFTRPADTIAYTAGDNIADTVNTTSTNPLRSIPIGRKGKEYNSGYITKLRLVTSQVACTARIRIHLYKKNSASAVVGDNVQNTLLYANRKDKIGSIDLPALATSTVSTGSDASETLDIISRLPFVLSSNDINIYYRLETLDGFTPDSGQTFYLQLVGDMN